MSENLIEKDLPDENIATPQESQRENIQGFATVGTTVGRPRSNSINITDQGQEGSCFAQSSTRIILRCIINVLGTERIPLPNMIDRENNRMCQNININTTESDKMFIIFKDCPGYSKNYYLLFLTIFNIIRFKFGCNGGFPDEVLEWFFDNLKNKKVEFIIEYKEIFTKFENYNEETFNLICDLFNEFCRIFYQSSWFTEENNFSLYNIIYNCDVDPNSYTPTVNRKPIIGAVFKKGNSVFNRIYKINTLNRNDITDDKKNHDMYFRFLREKGISVNLHYPNNDVIDTKFTDSGYKTYRIENPYIEQIQNNISIYDIIKYVLNSGYYIALNSHTHASFLYRSVHDAQHALTIVGYQYRYNKKEKINKLYLIVKNSWGISPKLNYFLPSYQKINTNDGTNSISIDELFSMETTKNYYFDLIFVLPNDLFIKNSVEIGDFDSLYKKVGKNKISRNVLPAVVDQNGGFLKYKITKKKINKKRTNKRKTNKRKTNKRKTNKRRINKRKTNKKICI